ncbi:MAG: ATP-dependent zinc metalloprotease FtsH [Actinomycetota bacterium]|nr:ATP-dependent zinc metalloprotease FtsH [Actinomycetota bacterium]
MAVILLLAGYLALLEYSKPHVTGQSLRVDQYLQLVEDGRVKEARLLDEDAIALGRYVRSDGAVVPYNARYLKTTGSQERLVKALLDNEVATSVDQQSGKKLIMPATMLLSSLILVVVFVYLILSYRMGTGLFGVKSGARKFKPEEGRVTFADVAGQQSAIEELRELASFLSEPERFAELGARIPRGILLYGPPGCGKTLLARALAGEAGASFYSISGSDFVELYVGVGAARVRDLFEEARENAPAIVFIDELDSVGSRRGGALAMQSSHSEQEQSLNQILAEMDGFSPLEGIIVIGATNRPDVLDPALLRPGRFDRTIGLEHPSEDDRLAILELHASTRRLDQGVDLRRTASRAHGLTGADLANVINEAALLAGRAGRPAIGQAELDEALKRILEAPERQRRLAMRNRGIGRRATSLDERVTFDDVAGVDEAIKELAEVRDYLSEPDHYTEVGARVPHGILLYGPPGCGKTLLARAVAGEANAAFYSVSATEFVEGIVGGGASRVRDVFADAKAVAPAIVFIDEIDVLGARTRNGPEDTQPHSEGVQTLNQLLVELDGFEARSGVIVMAATNRPDVLDPALLRPGRFDRQVEIRLPDQAGRRAILELHAKEKTLDPGVDLDAIAARAHGMTPADLANVVNEAALFAGRARKPAVSQAELEEAFDRVLEAPERQRRAAMRNRSVGRRATGIEERVTFADVAGVEDAIEELAEVKDFLAEPERFADMGARIPRGILLTGPPGCGKTLLAKAVAGEANAAFFTAAASEFVQIWVGQGAARVRDLFAEAKAMAPAIVFIDEIDSLGGHRGESLSGGGREYDQTVNQLLTELDGFEARSGVILMGATNRPDMLDSALLRPGRFDRQVEVTLPDRKGRRAILDVHARDKRLGDDVDLDVVAGVTQGFSGADLANVVNEAALLAARKQLPDIRREVVDEAIERVMLGVASRRHIMTDEERRIVAYHEAGHALVGLTLPGVTAPHKITIVPRGQALGYVWSIDKDERAIHSRSMLLNQMAMGLGGRTAEELVFGEPGSGASDDLARVSRTARWMVCELGMSEALGGVTYRDRFYADGDRSGLPGYSDEETRLVGAEVRRLVDEAHREARQVLEGSRATLDRIAEALLERETISADELEELVGPAPALSR